MMDVVSSTLVCIVQIKFSVNVPDAETDIRSQQEQKEKKKKPCAIVHVYNWN